ncbi:M56 family metallopeptidase [Polaribacter gochangensis]|uniref:M56 family metallopeptidase n=1 Tax=Polaribacter gochangensis TaxID=3252903 RepID=UPI003904C524
MLAYIIKSTICLVLLLAFYHFVLEKEKMHRFNRFYLLGSIVFSLIVPSFIITVAPAEFVEPILNQQENVLQFQSEYATTEIIQKIDYTNYFIGLYCIISLILLFLLTKKIYQLLAQTKRNKKVSYFSATVVLLKEKIVPYTFLHYIFINKKKYKTNAVEQQILTHELTHVQQKHSLDVLFIEVLQNLFWFNPIFRYYKKAIQLNHEFLADDAVLKSHKNIAEYQYVLLNTTAQQNNIYLASNLNYSLTKKRLLMMTTPSSKTKILLKKLMVIPLTAGFIFAFAQRVEAQENKNEKPQVVVVETEENGISEKEMNEYKELMTTAKRSKIFIYKQLNRMKELYKRMSVEQQNSVEDVYEIAPPMPPISHKEKTPTEAQFNSWKNKEKFALWIDGKVVNNTVLNNYKNTDFAYYFNSFVYKNARSNRFPQEHQVNLYTKKEFAKMKAKEAQEVKNTITLLIKNNGKLIIQNQTITLDKLEETLDKIVKDKDNALVILKGDSNKSTIHLNKVKNALRKYGLYKISINNKLLPPPPPMNIVQHYKQLFDKGSKSKIYKVKDIEKMISLYKKMSEKQQQSVTDIRKVVPPPPPMDIVFTYKKLAKRIQSTSKNRKANVIYLNELYNKMNASQKKQVTKPSRVLPPPPPKQKENEIDEEIKAFKRKNNIKPLSSNAKQELKTTEKLRIAHEKKHKSLNLKNNDSRGVVVSGGKMKMSLLETVKMWSKKGAGFVYNNKAITAKKGVEIVSEIKNIRVYSVEEERGKPILVYISDKK